MCPKLSSSSHPPTHTQDRSTASHPSRGQPAATLAQPGSRKSCLSPTAHVTSLLDPSSELTQGLSPRRVGSSGRPRLPSSLPWIMATAPDFLRLLFLPPERNLFLTWEWRDLFLEVPSSHHLLVVSLSPQVRGTGVPELTPLCSAPPASPSLLQASPGSSLFLGHAEHVPTPGSLPVVSACGYSAVR